MRYEPPDDDLVDAEDLPPAPKPPPPLKAIIQARNNGITVHPGALVEQPVGFLYYMNVVLQEEAEVARLKRIREKMMRDWEKHNFTGE